MSPTDAVATGIVKRAGISPRVVAILEGESLLNDATALVLLRAAIAAAAASFTVGVVTLTFLYSVVVAVVFGLVVGWLNLMVRQRVKDATVNTVISFTVPFLASIPAEALGASGLVAAVVAGLVTGSRAPRVLSPEHRLSDAQNWRTVELILEGLIFLTMGLELFGIVQNVQNDHAGVLPAVGIAAAALLLTHAGARRRSSPRCSHCWRERHRRGQRMRPRARPSCSSVCRIRRPRAGCCSGAASAGCDARADGGQVTRRTTRRRTRTCWPPTPTPRTRSWRRWRGVQEARRRHGDRLATPSAKQAERGDPAAAPRRGIPTVENLTRFGTRLRRVLADIEYFTGSAARLA